MHSSRSLEYWLKGGPVQKTKCPCSRNFLMVKLAKGVGIPRFSAAFNYMNLFSPYALLALAPSSQPGQAAPPAWVNMVPLGLLVVVFYFALIRPQQKKAKEHAALLKAVRAGDKIVTNSGIVAVIVTVKEKTLTIRSADAKLEITKSAITEILDRSAESSES